MINQKIAEKFNHLNAKQRDFLLKRLEEMKISPLTIPIFPIPAEKTLQLSFAQERLWFLTELDPNSNGYLLQRCLRLKGVISTQALQKSVDLVVQRHEALRTSIHKIEGNPVRIISEKVKMPVEIISLEEKSEREISSFLSEQAADFFDLSKAPLFRIKLFQVKKEECLLLILIHHIIADGWSIEILIDEISDFYNTIMQGKEPSMTSLPLHYSDYVAWQRNWFQDSLMQESLKFWDMTLKDAPKYSVFPYDFLDSSIQVEEGQLVEIELKNPICSKIQTYLKDSQLTSFNFFLALLKIAIHQYTGSTDLLVGTPTSGRLRSELSNIMGLMINTVILRNSIDRKDRFFEFARKVTQSSAEAFDHQVVPFERIIQHQGVDRDPYHSSLFQILFICHKGKQEFLKLEHLSWETVSIKPTSSKFAITFEVIETLSSFKINIEYDTALYKASTIQQIIEHFQLLVNSVLEDPSQKIYELSLISDQEKKLIDKWNQTTVDFPNKTIHELVVEACEMYSDSVAIKYKTNSLTYSDLQEQSDQLAKSLLFKGVMPGDKIGVYMGAGIELIPCLIGIFKAGCSYVPLDPSFPSQRLQLMVDETGIKTIIVNDSYDFIIAKDVKIFTFSSTLENLPCISLPIVCPTDVAYVMYTSGSTGKPKGIIVEHRSVVNVLLAFKRILGIQKHDHWFSVTTFAFDISVLEFFLPLINGATLHIAERLVTINIEELISDIQKIKPTIIQATPAFWHLLVLKKWKPEWDMTILCGGESLTSHLSSCLKQLSSRVFNVYGPTETTIWSTYHLLQQNERDVLIGKPIDNTKVFILDSEQLPVPINIEGDLYISGIGVSRGYLNQPELTQDRFVSLKHLGVQGLAFFTKDRAKFNDKGEIKFIGRSDYQVKIRGFRIEMQEIENILEQNENVQKAVICVRKDSFNSNFLVAFIQLIDSHGDKLLDLQTYLKEKVPLFMVPLHWKLLEEFPLLPNGKINREILNKHDLESGAFYEDSHVTEKQHLLCKIWMNNLKKEQIGIHDNYFELGGHSLLAVQLVDMISAQLKSNVTLKALFLNPTVAKLSEHLDKNDLSSKSDIVPGLIKSDLNTAFDPFPLTDVQRAYLVGKMNPFGDSRISSHLYRELIIKNLDIVRLESSLNALIQRHPAMRTIILPDAQQQVLKEVPYYEIKINDFTKLDQNSGGREFNKIRQEMAHQELSEIQWPLFDIRVSRLANFNYVHISISLLMADAASFEILLRELSQLYRNPFHVFSPLSITFKDYVQHISGIEVSSVFQQCKEYWIKRLNRFPAGPQLPIKYSLGQLKKINFKRYRYCLQKTKWDALKDKGKKTGISPNGLLIAAFSAVLSKWSNEPLFSIVLTLFNRLPLHPEIASIVGDFTTLSLFEVPNKANDSFTEFSKACQEQLFTDLDNRFYNGVLFTQDLLKNGLINEPIAVVFTSLLGFSSEALTLSSEFEEKATDCFNITQTPQVILDHQVMEQDGNLYLNWDVVEDVFPDHLLPIMFETYVAFLDLLSTSAERWDSVPILSFCDTVQCDEMELVLQKRQTEISWGSKSRLLHEGVLRQAKANPTNIAILQGISRISYGDLVEEAYKVKKQLATLKISKRSLIGVLMEKCWQQVSTSLGILMSGCAYVPIDAHLPLDRIRELLNESGCSIIFVDKKRADFLGICQIIYGEWTLEKHISQDAIEDVLPQQLAYVIYTSGSTGVPKGVMIQHQAVMHTIHAVNNHLGITEKDSIYGISSLSFDLSVYDIFGILSVGGRLILPDLNAIRNPAQWLNDIQTHGITMWNSVPYFVNMLMEYIKNKGNTDKIPFSLRIIMMSGDLIPPSLPPTVYSIFPEAKAISLGGATEASIWSIWYDIPNYTHFDATIPYGLSMDNQKVLVVDANFNETPVWVEGEIVIGGKGLAEGYWQNPSTTATHFLSHPEFGRIFRTFDIGRYLPNGMIEFLGRADRQVKVHGFRIELAEIEAKIGQYVGVQNAIVIVITKGENEKEMHAFVTFTIEKDGSHKMFDEQEILQYLQRKLPHYMIPMSVTLLDQIPVTRNGKVDQKALIKLHKDRPTIFSSKQLDEKGINEKLVATWKKVLRISHIPNYQTSFFDLGGNSFKLIQLHGEIQRLMQAEIAIVDLFRFSTIDEQIAYFSKKTEKKEIFKQSKNRAELRKKLRKG